MSFRIQVTCSRAEPVKFAFSTESVSVGRGDFNDVVVSDIGVSAQHGQLSMSAENLLYTDLDSRNGSRLIRARDGREIRLSFGESVTLFADDELQIGTSSAPVSLHARLEESTQVNAARPPLPRRVEGAKDRSVELTARLEVGNAAVEELSSNFDRTALLALHAHSVGTTHINEVGPLIEHFVKCTFELLTKATHISIQTLDDSLPELSKDRSGDVPVTPMSSTVRQCVIEESEAVAFLDADEVMDASESLRLSNVRAGLCAPLRRGDEIVGFAQVDCRGKLLGAFDYRDLEVFAVLTHQMGLAAANIGLTRELRATVDELKLARGEMEKMAFYDPLTGLYNRRLFIERLEQAVHSAARNSRRACLLYIDLDNFKLTDDTLGHHTGDQLLAEIAVRLRACVRGNDTVGRLGGDEFAILLDEIGDASKARAVCEKVLEILREPFNIDGHELRTTASIGVAISDDDGTDAVTFLKNADMALYRAKRRARNTFEFFTEELNIEVTNRVNLEAQLRHALDHNEFLHHYQPLVRLSDQKIIGVEALVRWQHPARGLLSPVEFIGLAEDSGLITQLGAWCMRDACERMVKGRAGNSNWRLSLNLSVRQLADPDFPAKVREVLDETGLPASRLELEITKSMLMETAESIPNLHYLREMGATLAIDDFGTGYSSFGYLKELPLDVLKADKSFVDMTPVKQRDTEIASAIIAMGHKLGMCVVAEGIETKEQLVILSEIGCDVGQGFFLYMPG